jgi:hypothetical protein
MGTIKDNSADGRRRLLSDNSSPPPQMNGVQTLIFLAIACFFSCTAAAEPKTPSPANPCDIVDSVSHFVIPRINYRKTASLREVLSFIYSTYNDVDIDPPRNTTFVFEYRLPESVLARPVTLQANDITMIRAIKQLFIGIPVVLAFEPGKVVF